jgi:ComF family protein
MIRFYTGRVRTLRLLYSSLLATLNIAALGRAALDFVYPPRCAVCGSHGSFLCGRCEPALPAAGGRRCGICWLPMAGPECRNCAEQAFAFTALRSAFRYAGNVRTLVHALKYGGQSCLAAPLAAPMLRAFQHAGFDAGVIVPVPMTGIRARSRGYNQAALLARELGRPLALPAAAALRRRSFRGPQARSNTAQQRRENVRGAFACSAGALVAGQKVLLVDDVATTCATLDACARALIEAGAQQVVCLTLARED